MWIPCTGRPGALGRPPYPDYGGWMRVFYLLTLWHTIFSQTDDRGYSISTKLIYKAYTEDLELRYTIPKGDSLPNAYIQLVSLGSPEKEITTLSMSLGLSSGSLRVTCGVIEYAGHFAFRMFMQHGGRKLAETKFEVQWPDISLQLPPQHIAQTDGIFLTLKSKARCDALLHKYNFWLEVQYVGDDRDSASREVVQPFTVFRKNVSAINEQTITEPIECNSVDLAGFYQVVFKSSYNSSTDISKSNLMYITWSHTYNISTYSDKPSIFPCDRTLVLFYKQPMCPGEKDKIRIYKLVRNVQGSLATPIELEYVLERYAINGGRTLDVDCNLFEPETLGYCFIYVSLSKIGAVTEQKKHCLPTHKDAGLIADGHWSSWSPWGQCSVSCGSGKKSRFRMCNNPPPLNGGKFCVGDPFQWTVCSSVCPESLSEQTPLYSVKLQEECACGCTMRNGTGKIVATGRCMGLSVWRIHVRQDLRIKLSFVYLDFYKNLQWVQIRNGGSREDQLLAFSDGSEHLGDVFSTTNEMLVEFMTKSDSSPSTSLGLILLKPTEKIHVHGFIAYYNVLNNNVSIAAPNLTPITQPVWENAITIAGIVVCVMVVIGTIFFVIYHRIHKRRHPKYKMANTESPTSPVHNKGTSIVQTPSSPDELESPGVDMETPLTGELKRKELPSTSGKNRGSVSSTSSAGYKRLRTKADIEKTPSRSYTPLQSPYAANASNDDFRHDQNFFKGCRPRSPKVHPSPKSRRASKSPTSTPTKHSILTKALVERRKDEGDNRIVVGASSTPTCSPSTSKGEELDTTKPKKKEKPHKKDNQSVKNNESLSRTTKPSVASETKMKGGKKKVKSSGVCTPIKNGVEMQVKSITPCDSSAKHSTTEFTNSGTKARRPTSLTDSYDSDKAKKTSPNSNKKYRFLKKRQPPKQGTPVVTGSVEERQKCLPRPDGQSPENIREDKMVASSASTPKSLKSLRSNKTLSPTKSVRSANTPSDMAELEYDDFIEDDPLSYFEYDEMLKLRWHGVEKIGKPLKEEDSGSVNVNGIGKP